jgi:hypothetical protein
MSTITQYGSTKFTGSHPSKLPDGIGDIFSEQDRIRDFSWLWDRTGYLGLDLLPSIGCPHITGPFVAAGGLVTQGADVSHVNITAAVGYAPFLIDLGDSGASPPTTSSEDISAVRVTSSSVTGIALAGGVQGKVTGSATLNGVAVNYVKLRYVETDSLSRTRQRSGGTWAFTKVPDWSMLIDTVAPTAYEIVLATFIGDGAATLTIVQYYPPGKSLVLSSPSGTFTIGNDGLRNIFLSSPVTGLVIQLPNSAYNVGRRILVKNKNVTAALVYVTPYPGDYLSESLNSQWILGGGSTYSHVRDYVELELQGNSWNVIRANPCIFSYNSTAGTQGAPTTATWYNVASNSWTLAAGRYKINFAVEIGSTLSVAGAVKLSVGFGTSAGGGLIADSIAEAQIFSSPAATMNGLYFTKSFIYSSTGNPIYLNARLTGANLTTLHLAPSGSANCQIWFERVG